MGLGTSPFCLAFGIWSLASCPPRSARWRSRAQLKRCFLFAIAARRVEGARHSPHESRPRIPYDQPIALRCRTVRIPALPQRVGTDAAQARHSGVRSVADGALPRDRPRRRIVPHPGQPGRACPHPTSAGETAAFRRLRPLRRTAAGSPRIVEVAAVRGDHPGPQAVRPRLRGQQGPALCPPQGGRSLFQDRDGAPVRSVFCARRRGGDQQREPAPVSAPAPPGVALRCGRRVRQ